MNEKQQNFIVKYFSEFGVLRECGKNFWLTNFIQFFDGLSYFTLIIVFSLFLNKYCGFRDADAPYWVGMYTLFVSLFVFAVGTICDIIGLLKDGDIISIDIPARSMNVELSDEEIAARRAVWQPTMQEIPSKWLKRYRKLATNASKGAVLA